MPSIDQSLYILFVDFYFSVTCTRVHKYESSIGIGIGIRYRQACNILYSTFSYGCKKAYALNSPSIPFLFSHSNIVSIYSEIYSHAFKPCFLFCPIHNVSLVSTFALPRYKRRNSGGIAPDAQRRLSKLEVLRIIVLIEQFFQSRNYYVLLEFVTRSTYDVRI